jgi:hypothetical protein
MTHGMKRNSHNETNLERQRNLQRDEESFHFRHEEKRLIGARHSSIFIWSANSISWLVEMLAILLVIRFVLRWFGANFGFFYCSVFYLIHQPYCRRWSQRFRCDCFDCDRSLQPFGLSRSLSGQIHVLSRGITSAINLNQIELLVALCFGVSKSKRLICPL